MKKIILIIFICLIIAGIFVGRHYLVSPQVRTLPEHGPLIDFSKDVTRHQYSSADRNVFYLAIPEKDKEQKKTKLVIWVHGGAFIKGDPFRDMLEYGGFFFKNGFAVASIGYRLCPDVKWPGPVKDIARGVLAVLNELKDQGFEITDITYSGLSAGATAGGLLFYSDKYPSVSGVDRFIAFSAASNPDSTMHIKNVSTANEIKEVIVRCGTTIHQTLVYSQNPKTQVPALLIEGEADEFDAYPLTNDSHSEYLARILKEQGVYAETYWGRNDEGTCGHTCPLDMVIQGDEKIISVIEAFMEKKP